MQDHDEIGFKKPPKGTRFKSGQSGNPRGRPKGSASRKSILEKFAAETHTVLVHGKKQRLTTVEVVLLKLRNLALGGDAAAIDHFEKLQNKYDPQHFDVEQLGYLLVHETMTPEEAIAEGEKANAEARARWQAEANKKATDGDTGS